MAVELTAEEIERYAPYHTYPEFQLGFDEYGSGLWHGNRCDENTVGGQAYDRGAECAMRRGMARLRARQTPSGCA